MGQCGMHARRAETMHQSEFDPAEGNASEWQVLGREDPLHDPPAAIAPPLAVPAPVNLNTGDLPWETVEHLVVALARQVDGAHEVRRYGRPGQAQQGIDIVGFFSHAPPAVYQCKRVQSFGAGDLAEAVGRYIGGRRPFPSRRLVVVTTADASDTRVIDRLEALRAEHGPLVIDLWGRNDISDLLRGRPDLVERFFGRATADAFCGARSGQGRERRPLESVSSDAILRGPIAHLGLKQQLLEADGARERDPGAAAAGYGRIAAALDASPYAPHALDVRERQSKALRAAGDGAAALRVDLKIMADELAAGDAFGALTVGGRAEEHPIQGQEDALRAVVALGTVASYEHHHDTDLAEVAAAFDATTDATPYRLEAATLFAEHAVAARRTDLVRVRSPVLASVADRAPGTNEGLRLRARLRAGLADSTGDWAPLALDARIEYPPGVAALILARYGRHLAGRGSTAAAVVSYYDAIERACQAGNHGDAADWLFAVRDVRLLEGNVWSTHTELFRLATALRAAGNGSVMPSAFSARAQALARLQARSHPDALQALQRYRWRRSCSAPSPRSERRTS